LILSLRSKPPASIDMENVFRARNSSARRVGELATLFPLTDRA